MSNGYLRKLGVFGYDAVEPVILGALVSEDPLLLIGKAGTGKTFLLNSLSEALGLEHRHYNASLIAFDDLVGFPWPEAEGKAIRYIETPATVWQAESVLVDEINRCKPEHQNRLFSLVHERRIQGLKLAKLRYRWAAMNPAGFEQQGETYAGCEPLDAALADRFAFLIQVEDWPELSEEDRLSIADPLGEGAISRDSGELTRFLSAARTAFRSKLAAPQARTIDYACRAANALGQAGVRLSPRRVRQLVRNLLAVESASGLPKQRVFRLALGWSLPQRAGCACPDEAAIDAAHRMAWDPVFSEGEERWLHFFHAEPLLERKLELLLGSCADPETGTLAVSQFLASEPVERQAAFAFCLYPALVAHPNPPVGAEGIQDLGTVALPILELESEVKWIDHQRTPNRPPAGGLWDGLHPQFAAVQPVLESLPKRQRRKVEQLFLSLLARSRMPADARDYANTVLKSLAICRKFHGTPAV